ncbi:MAG: MotA/TolQ/ExbB proton channel family protein [Ottowia sp.]|nr:MotA/TolQ/ExbB proton channel family protein [Ottowia sp.]
MGNYGLMNLWYEGDGVIRSVTVFLLLMSLASWTVILNKAWDAIRTYRLNARMFWFADTFEHGLDTLGTNTDNPFRQLALVAQEASQHHQNQQPQLHDRLNMSDWITRCLKNTVDEIQGKMQSGLALLASVGSTAPFVGLFGTVWGIYHALISMSTAGASTIDKVAGPVGEALIMTALGLAVAIPAVLGYNALTRANKTASARLHRFAHDLHAYFVTGNRVTNTITTP